MIPLASVIQGVGHALPEQVITNHDLEKQIETTHEWIESRTGICQRHFVSGSQKTSDLAIEAAKNALTHANIDPKEIDLIILATVTGDEVFPSTATKVQAALGCTGYAYDISAACSGFLLALKNADHAIRLGEAKTVLVIGAETFSNLLDMNDRRTCVLFGDGAGAVVLKAVPQDEANGRGIIGIDLVSEGNLHDLLYVNGGVCSQEKGVIQMQGSDVYRHAITKLPKIAEGILEKYQTSVEEIDWFVPHQANLRIMNSVADKLGIPKEKRIETVQHHANTSAASIPLALSYAVREGKIKPGDLILQEAIGAGLIWGAALVRW